MSGWETLKAIRLLEERVSALGLEMVDAADSYGSKFSKETYGDRVALRPKDDSMPHYSRDAIVWLGSLEELNHWLNGVDWARQYDTMLKISDHKKRSKAEADERNRQLMSTIKHSRLVQGAIRGIAPEYDEEVDDDMKDDVPF